jgi:pimeloyl-ACP methyl ester carboxylesterase
MRARDIVVDGIRLHVTEAGRGPALLMLHGLGATRVNWEHTIAAFSSRFRVIAPDLPGHGRSEKPDAPYTIDFFAGVMRSLGRELGIDEAVVIGNSLGGQIAVQIALDYPTWTRALVLAAPAGGFGQTVSALSWTIRAVAGPRVLSVALPYALERCVFDRTRAEHLERRRILAERIAHEDYPSFARAVNRSLMGAIAAGRQPLHLIRQPVLLVWGRDDRLLAISGSRRLTRAVPHARLAVLERCGHHPMLEQPEQFNRLVADFLRSVETAPVLAPRRASGDT